MSGSKSPHGKNSYMRRLWSGKEHIIMPGKKHLRGGTKKEQRQYEKIKKSAQSSGRYGKRAKEVAARTVMKQRSKKKR
jgi:hypothetical protein